MTTLAVSVCMNQQSAPVGMKRPQDTRVASTVSLRTFSLTPMNKLNFPKIMNISTQFYQEDETSFTLQHEYQETFLDRLRSLFKGDTTILNVVIRTNSPAGRDLANFFKAQEKPKATPTISYTATVKLPPKVRTTRKSKSKKD